MSEGVALVREHRENARDGFDVIFTDVDEYDELLRTYAAMRLTDAATLEIGFGARPYRQMLLHSMGVPARGVEAQVPVLRGHPAEFYAMARKNGMERAVKSLIRHVAFDRRERRMLRRAMRQRGLVPQLDTSKLIIGDARDLQIARLLEHPDGGLARRVAAP
jgi:hypothetical protein